MAHSGHSTKLAIIIAILLSKNTIITYLFFCKLVFKCNNIWWTLLLTVGFFSQMDLFLSSGCNSDWPPRRKLANPWRGALATLDLIWAVASEEKAQEKQIGKTWFFQGLQDSLNSAWAGDSCSFTSFSELKKTFGLGTWTRVVWSSSWSRVT